MNRFEADQLNIYAYGDIRVRTAKCPLGKPACISGKTKAICPFWLGGSIHASGPFVLACGCPIDHIKINPRMLLYDHIYVPWTSLKEKDGIQCPDHGALNVIHGEHKKFGRFAWASCHQCELSFIASPDADFSMKSVIMDQENLELLLTTLGDELKGKPA